MTTRLLDAFRAKVWALLEGLGFGRTSVRGPGASPPEEDAELEDWLAAHLAQARLGAARFDAFLGLVQALDALEDPDLVRMLAGCRRAAREPAGDEDVCAALAALVAELAAARAAGARPDPAALVRRGGGVIFALDQFPAPFRLAWGVGVELAGAGVEEPARRVLLALGHLAQALGAEPLAAAARWN